MINAWKNIGHAAYNIYENGEYLQPPRTASSTVVNIGPGEQELYDGMLPIAREVFAERAAGIDPTHGALFFGTPKTSAYNVVGPYGTPATTHIGPLWNPPEHLYRWVVTWGPTSGPHGI